MRSTGLVLCAMVIGGGMATGCSSDGTSSTTSSLVADAVAAVADTHAAAKACFDAFDTCIAAAASDATAVTQCQATLGACLPTDSAVAEAAPDLCSETAPTDRPDCGGGGEHGAPPDGGMRGEGPEHDGAGGPGGGDRGGRGGDPGGPGGPPVDSATRIELATCRAQAKACVDGGGDPMTCREAEHTCVDDALAAGFAALCADVTTQCTACPTSKACVELTARCAEGAQLPGDTTTTAGE